MVIRAIIETQETERIRVGKNLHDSVGQKLVATKRFLEELALKNPELKSSEVYKQSKETINDTIADLKNICFNIMPKTLEAVGLKGAVRELISQSQIKGSLEMEFNMQNDFPKLNSQQEIAIYRIVQEFISNSMNHANAKKISLDFKSDPGYLYILLKDDGFGFDVTKAYEGKGMGLKNINSRVQSYGGVINVKSKPGEGTEFYIKLPIERV
jgi:signal transduction histidine kinase